MNHEDTRRVKRITISARHLLEFVNCQNGTPSFVTITKADLPKGSHVSYLGMDQLGLNIEMLVWHESFPVVTQGEVPPYLHEGDRPFMVNEVYALATEAELRIRQPAVVCAACDGTGKGRQGVADYPCRECKGTGWKVPPVPPAPPVQVMTARCKQFVCSGRDSFHQCVKGTGHKGDHKFQEKAVDRLE